MKFLTTSKFKYLSLAALVAASLFAPASVQAEKLVASQIQVYDNVVRLGDIFDVNGIFANEQLFQAPPLGRKGTLSATSLHKIAKKYSLDWANEQRFAKITITRKAKNIELADITKIITDYAIDNQLIAGSIGQTKIKINQKFRTILIAASDYAEFSISDFVYRPYSDQFSVEFRYVHNGAYRQLKLSGKIENMVQVPVFANNIRRDQTIKMSDIKYIQINNRRIANNILLDVDDIVGKSAKNSIRAMQPVSEHLLKFADLVKKNRIINLQFKLGRVSLNIKARALSTGGKGALIRVMNLKSGKQIDAIVTGLDQAMTLNSILTPNNKNAKIASNN